MGDFHAFGHTVRRRASRASPPQTATLAGRHIPERIIAFNIGRNNSSVIGRAGPRGRGRADCRAGGLHFGKRLIAVCFSCLLSFSDRRIRHSS